MNKKITLTLLILLLIPFAGCSKSDNSELPLKEKISKKYEYYNTIKCSDIDNVIDLDFSGFVTKDRAYELNMEQLYSNDENCKEIPINNLNDVIIAGGGKFAYTKNNKYGIGKGIIKEVYVNEAYRLFDTLGENVIFHDSRVKVGYYTVSVDNKIKMIKTDNIEEGISISKTIDIEDKFESDEQVISISEYFIKTNKAYYKVQKYKENKEECEKYADVSCKYSFKIIKDDILTDNYDDILFAGFYIIDKDHNVYKYK